MMILTVMLEFSVKIVSYFTKCLQGPPTQFAVLPSSASTSPKLWMRLALISISPHHPHPHPHPPDHKSREFNFLGHPHLQFQLKLTSEDILTKLLI